MSLWFLEASDAVLVRRFSETRRPHPLDPNRAGPGSDRARARIARADPSNGGPHSRHLAVHDSRTCASTRCGCSRSRQAQHLLVSLVSFGFKYGVPIDSDLVFDVRFLPNPNFVPHLKPHTGADPARHGVHELARSDARIPRTRLRVSSIFCFRNTRRKAKSYVTISIGCTGGRHRSVFIANAIAEHLDGRSIASKFRTATPRRKVSIDASAQPLKA